MLKREELVEMLSCISELQQLFNSNDDVLPFLRKLRAFMSTQVPLMADLRQTITDSSQKLPIASHRIDDVSTATEFATMEILDALDRMAISTEKLSQQSQAGEQEDVSDLLEEIAIIVNALQFQDITSQKLSHANTILSAISETHQEMARTFKAVSLDDALGGSILNDSSQSGHAEEREKKKALFEERTKDEIRQDIVTQEDIDALFNEK